MSASGKNMEAVAKAKQHHNENCPFNGLATRVLMHPYDIERLGWEEGDAICGLLIEADAQVNTGMFRVVCDAEPGDDGPELVEAKGKDLVAA